MNLIDTPFTVGFLVLLAALLLKKIHKALFAPWKNCPPGTTTNCLRFSQTKEFSINHDCCTISGVILGMPTSLNPMKFFRQVKLINASPLKAFHQIIQENGPVVRIATGGNIAVLLGGKKHTFCAHFAAKS